jgi:hypothetical protein
MYSIGRKYIVIVPSFPFVGNGGGMPFSISAKTENFVNSTK